MTRHALLPLFLLAGCAAQPAAGDATKDEPQVGKSAPSNPCNAAAAQFAVNQSYSEALAEQARKAAGAATVRQLVPGQVVTQDYRADRLNLELSGDGKVAKVRCG